MQVHPAIALLAQAILVYALAPIPLPLFSGNETRVGWTAGAAFE
jgi:hypothetical protein